MSEEEVIAVMEEYVRGDKRGSLIPFLSEDADIITAYCLATKEVSLGCPDCVLKKRYGKGERCPVVVTLGG